MFFYFFLVQNFKTKVLTGRDIRWNIAWSRGKSRRQSPRDFLGGSGYTSLYIPTWVIIQTLLIKWFLEMFWPFFLAQNFKTKVLSGRDIRWNIAWAQGKSWGQSPRDFFEGSGYTSPYIQTWLIIQKLLISKSYIPVLSFSVGQYWMSWFSILAQ